MRASRAKLAVLISIVLLLFCFGSRLIASPAPDQATPSDPRFTATSVAEHVWRIDDKGAGNIYLVEGKDKALLIDTGIGEGNLREFVAKMTNLPVTVVNTHGHRDHAGSNFQFDDVYAHSADFNLIKRSDNHDKRAATLKPVVLHQIKEGYQFDLGGRKLQVIETPGHTPGSIVLLDSANKILFSGDNDNTLVWLFLRDSRPLEVYLATLEKVNGRAGEFDTILPGHGGPLDKTFVADQIRATQSILNGTCVAKPYKSSAGDAMLCEYRRASVAFDPNNLRKKN